MKRIVFCCSILVVSLIAIYSCSMPAMTVNSKQDTSIVIDGKVNDWGNNFKFDKNSKLQYAVSKDDKNLFICLKAKNQSLEKKIKTFGLTLWIDTTGKHKENMGIRFPLGNKELNVSRNNKNKRTEAEERELFLKNSYEMEVKGFPVLGEYGNEFTRLDIKSKLGIQAYIDFDSLNTMVYELKIPYNVMFQGKMPSNITLKFITGSIDIESKRENFDEANRPGSVTTGMNGYATGGGGNLANVPGSKEYFTMMEPSELKFNINLSGNK